MAIATPQVPARSALLSPRTAVCVVVAAIAMVATLPGRTHGLGVVTEPLLGDLGLDRVAFAGLNLWATLLGAAFCIPCGWLLDRFGVGPVLAVVLVGLGTVVVAMAGLPASGTDTIALPAPDLFAGGAIEWLAVPLNLFLLVLLTRGLGQSALSVASLALVGKAAGTKPGPVIGAYSFLVAVGFMTAFAVIKRASDVWHADWRTLWAGIGWSLVGLGVIVWPMIHAARPPRSDDGPESTSGPEAGATLGAALRTPAFWVFGVATSFYGMVAAGLALFNQSVLAERHFDRSVFLTIAAISPMIGLAANLATGWLATRVGMGSLLAAALTLLAAALAAFPLVATLTHVYVYAGAMGVAGGMVTVIFFGVWRQAYGTRHLGAIQGAAQLLTVLASAVGPLVLAAGQRASGSYAPVMQALAVVSLVLAVAAGIVPMPDPNGETR